MSSTAGTVAGIAAHVFLSNDVVQSRLSTHVRMYSLQLAKKFAVNTVQHETEL